MRLIHRAGGCDDGTCPNVFDTDQKNDDQEELVAVQGSTLIDADALARLRRMPDHESVVLVPKILLLEYAKAATKEV